MIVTSATSQIFYKKTLTAHKCGMTLPPKNIVFHHILGKTISKQREFVAFSENCVTFLQYFAPPPKKNIIQKTTLAIIICSSGGI
jgi:hypothetical protein